MLARSVLLPTAIRETRSLPSVPLVNCLRLNSERGYFSSSKKFRGMAVGGSIAVEDEDMKERCVHDRTEATLEKNPTNVITGLTPWDLKSYMAPKIAAVNEAINLAVPIRYPEEIHEAMRYSLFGGGKRLCSVASIAACELFGGEQEVIMPIACALEMIHDASIVHDDLPCMDNGLLRRGRPSTHVAFGESTAVLTGDALICRAFEHIARETKSVSAEKVLRVIAHIARSVGCEGMVAGQFVDLESTGNPSISLETLEFIHLHKTASLVESSIVSGAIVGGACEEDIESLAEFGRTLGLMFQVVDDLLDFTKSSEELGKPAGADGLTDKATYPKLLGLEKTQLYVDELLVRANRQISKFDPVKAAPLIALAEYVVKRKG